MQTLVILVVNFKEGSKKLERFQRFLRQNIDFESQIKALFDTSQLHQLSKFNNFLWVCWFLGKSLSNFVSPAWKLDNPYCHNLKTHRHIHPGQLLTNWHNGAKIIVLSHSIVLPPIFQIKENVKNILVKPSRRTGETISKLLRLYCDPYQLCPCGSK